jgi:hypothetical protein
MPKVNRGEIWQIDFRSKILNLIFAACLSTAFAANAASFVSEVSGTVFDFGEWSKPVLINIPAVDGSTPVVSRECTVTIDRGRSRPETRKLKMLCYPAANEIWIGELYDQYLMMGQKIWGISQRSGTLYIRTSMPAEDAGDEQDVNAVSFLRLFSNNPSSIFWSEGPVAILPLDNVFGAVTLYGKDFMYTGAMWRPCLQWTNVSAGSDKATIRFHALVTSLDLSVSLNRDQEIVEAILGSETLPLLWRSARTGQYPSDLGTWLCPSYKELPSPKGPQSALICINEYTKLDDAGNWTTLGRAKSAVLVATRDLWIGPVTCDVLVVGRRIIGVNIDNASREVQFYIGPRARLPLGPGSSETYQAEVRKFGASFSANAYKWAPDYRISIPALFVGDSRFATDCWFSKRTVSLESENLVIGLNSGNSQAHPEITLGPDLQVLSTRVLPYNAPELRIPSDFNTNKIYQILEE